MYISGQSIHDKEEKDDDVDADNNNDNDEKHLYEVSCFVAFVRMPQKQQTIE